MKLTTISTNSWLQSNPLNQNHSLCTGHGMDIRSFNYLAVDPISKQKITS